MPSSMRGADPVGRPTLTPMAGPPSSSSSYRSRAEVVGGEEGGVVRERGDV
jgi:hypothetical protein